MNTALFTIGFLIILTIAWIIRKSMQESNDLLASYAKRLDNFYEIMDSPSDTEVYKRCRDHINMLIKSGNALRGKDKAVKVYGIVHKSLDVRVFWLDAKNGETKIAKCEMARYARPPSYPFGFFSQ